MKRKYLGFGYFVSKFLVKGGPYCPSNSFPDLLGILFVGVLHGQDTISFGHTCLYKYINSHDSLIGVWVVVWGLICIIYMQI